MVLNEYILKTIEVEFLLPLKLLLTLLSPILFLSIHKKVLFAKISKAQKICEDACKSYQVAANPADLRTGSLWRQQLLVQNSSMSVPDANSLLLLKTALHCQNTVHINVCLGLGVLY